jgi:hypothetical protein
MINLTLVFRIKKKKIKVLDLLPSTKLYARLYYAMLGHR